MKIKSFLRSLYFSPLGYIVSRFIFPLVRAAKQPNMLWGFRDSSGKWRRNTRISDTALLYQRQNIRVDDMVFIWHYTILDGTGGLDIGEGTQIGAWVGIFTHSSHIAIRVNGPRYHEVPESEKKGFLIKPTKIGRHVFVGAGARIMPGVTIGDGALISSGALVNSSVPPFQIVGGNPAKIIGDVRHLDQKYLRRNPEIKAWYETWLASIEAPGSSMTGESKSNE